MYKTYCTSATAINDQNGPGGRDVLLGVECHKIGRCQGLGNSIHSIKSRGKRCLEESDLQRFIVPYRICHPAVFLDLTETPITAIAFAFRRFEELRRERVQDIQQKFFEIVLPCSQPHDASGSPPDRLSRAWCFRKQWRRIKTAHPAHNTNYSANGWELRPAPPWFFPYRVSWISEDASLLLDHCQLTVMVVVPRSIPRYKPTDWSVIAQRTWREPGKI